jgi:hypothetical protein
MLQELYVVLGWITITLLRNTKPDDVTQNQGTLIITQPQEH